MINKIKVFFGLNKGMVSNAESVSVSIGAEIKKKVAEEKKKFASPKMPVFLFDEFYAINNRTPLVTFQKKPTKKINNCRDLEYKNKRKFA